MLLTQIFLKLLSELGLWLSTRFPTFLFYFFFYLLPTLLTSPGCCFGALFPPVPCLVVWRLCRVFESVTSCLFWTEVSTSVKFEVSLTSLGLLNCFSWYFLLFFLDFDHFDHIVTVTVSYHCSMAQLTEFSADKQETWVWSSSVNSLWQLHIMRTSLLSPLITSQTTLNTWSMPLVMYISTS